MRPALAIAAALVLVGCPGGGGGSGRKTGADITQGISGTVFFEKRLTSPAGLGGDDEVVLAPARFVRVAAVRIRGGSVKTIARTITDAFGR